VAQGMLRRKWCGVEGMWADLMFGGTKDGLGDGNVASELSERTDEGHLLVIRVRTI
jgi:hypothetical protein